MLMVPETATMLVNSGVDLVEVGAWNPERAARVQRALVNIQTSLRSRYLSLAEALGHDRTVILYDRAECDNAAYMPPDTLDAILAEDGRTLLEVRDSYHAVAHLVTAAFGAEHAYTTENNHARTETPDEARDLDTRTLHAWLGHPRLAVVGNTVGFDEKMNKLVNVVLAAIGADQDDRTLDVDRRWLLAEAPDLTCPELAGAVEVDVEQVYLSADSDGVERRVRRRRQGTGTSYDMTVKERLADGGRAERVDVITPLAYLGLSAKGDPSRQPLRKTRWSFVWDHRVFSLDHVREPNDCWVLEEELVPGDLRLPPPTFLPVSVDVTGVPEWSGAGLAVPR